MKKIIKYLIKLFAFFIALYYIFLHKYLKFNYKTVSIMISKWTGYFGIIIREYYYKNTLKFCGKNLRVFYGAYIVYPEVEIGDNCTIEEYSIISLSKIGDNVIIAARCSLMSGGKHHDIDDIENTFYNSKEILKKIELGDNLWIGTHSVILEDVNSHTAIAAGSIVTKKFPMYSLIGGVPSKLIKRRGRYNNE